MRGVSIVAGIALWALVPYAYQASAVRSTNGSAK